MFLAVLMYGPVTPRFYMKYQGYVAQIAQAMPHTRPSILTSNAPYVEDATTNIVQTALTDSDWDYLVFLEHDNIAPDDWANVVCNELDPDIHKIVGRWYFGKAQEDMRSICGYIRPNGDFDRLSYNEVQFFRSNPGLYRVGAGMAGVDDTALTLTVGLGCTAIHRSVFENWTGKMPWFQSIMEWHPHPDHPSKGFRSMLGHDVNFCLEAHKQGIDVWLDTRKPSGHIGEFVSDDITYTATVQNMIATGQATPDELDGKPRLHEGVPTAMSEVELAKLVELAKGKHVLEIGSRLGASTIAMAGGGAQLVYALDWHRGDKWHEGDGRGNTLDEFWRYCEKFGVRDKVIPLVGRSEHLLPMFREASFDLIFIDGDHSYDGVRYDLEWVRRLVKPGGTIALHDYGPTEVTQFLQGTDREVGVTRAATDTLGEPGELVDSLAIYSA